MDKNGRRWYVDKSDIWKDGGPVPDLTPAYTKVLDDPSVADSGYHYAPGQGGMFDELVEGPEDSSEVPECSKRHVFGYDKRGCVACQTRFAWVRKSASEALGRKYSASLTFPADSSLTDLLEEPDSSEPDLIEGIWPLGGNVLLSAKAKAGKTTMRNNVIRSLVDGTPFLDHFEIPDKVSRVVVIDLELTRTMSKSWLRKQDIEHTDSIRLHTLRGQAHLLDIRVRSIRDHWVKILHGADVVILDCLEPVLGALVLNPNSDARAFLDMWSSMLTEAEAVSSLVLHHHGHVAERAKGDSQVLAWPDAIWDMVYKDPDPNNPDNLAGPRYFKARGRDVEVPDGRLVLDLETRRMRYVGGASRALDRASDAKTCTRDDLLKVLLQDHNKRIKNGEGDPTDGCSARWGSKAEVEAIADNAGIGRNQARKAIDESLKSGLLVSSKTSGSRAQVLALSKAGMERARTVGQPVDIISD
jgi:hypothetical protein